MDTSLAGEGISFITQLRCIGGGLAVGDCAVVYVVSVVHSSTDFLEKYPYLKFLPPSGKGHQS